MTNKDLAAAAGITTGALYHYVESKLDLYAEVHADVQLRIYSRFQEAVDSHRTFLGKLEAVLEAAYEMGIEDPSLAGFVGSVRSDNRRHEEVRERLARAVAERDRFFLALVDVGIETGEIAENDRPLVREFIRIVLVGLTEGTSGSVTQQRMAIDAVKAMLRGQLITPVDP